MHTRDTGFSQKIKVGDTLKRVEWEHGTGNQKGSNKNGSKTFIGATIKTNDSALIKAIENSNDFKNKVIVEFKKVKEKESGKEEKK